MHPTASCRVSAIEPRAPGRACAPPRSALALRAAVRRVRALELDDARVEHVTDVGREEVVHAPVDHAAAHVIGCAARLLRPLAATPAAPAAPSAPGVWLRVRLALRCHLDRP